MNILSNLVTDKAAQSFEFVGTDSPTRCIDIDKFQAHKKIIYSYNERGFRDDAWPENIDELKDSIWVIGQDMSLGIGLVREDTWIYKLSQLLDQRFINVSKESADNDWIEQTAINVITELAPKRVIVQWSRINHYFNSFFGDHLDHVDNIHAKIQSVELIKGSTAVTHTFCYDSCIPGPEQRAYREWAFRMDKSVNIVSPVTKLDFARDGLNSGSLTAAATATQFFRVLSGSKLSGPNWM